MKKIFEIYEGEFEQLGDAIKKWLIEKGCIDKDGYGIKEFKLIVEIVEES